MDTLLWRAELIGKQDNVNDICFHHEQLFGNVFVRNSKKCCGVLKLHRSKAKAHTEVSLDMAKILKSKNFNVIPGQKFCRHCMEKYNTLLESDNEMTEPEEDITEPVNKTTELDEPYVEEEVCESSPRKRQLNSSLESIGVSPVNVHGVAQRSRALNAKSKLRKVMDAYKEDIASAYNIENCELDPEPEQKNNEAIEKKAIELDRLHAAMKEKLSTSSNSEKIQILTLVPDSWSRKDCAEYFNVSEYLIRSARNLKQKKGILAKPDPKKGKTMSQQTIDLVHAFYQDDEYSRQLPGKKDFVSIAKGVHRQKRLILGNLHELYVAFKEKYPEVKIGFSKFCSLRPKWCVVAGSSGTHSVCVCTSHQNAILLVDALNWDFTYKDLMKKIVCDITNRECMMRHCPNCPGNGALRRFLDEELTEFEPDSEFHYSQWETTDRAAR